MDSPVRKALKRNDYLRHKLFRKIKRRQRNKIQLDLKIAEKELKRKLRRPKFDSGSDGNLSDEQYYSIMLRVAKENWQKWGDPSEEAALIRILNDNSYDYRGYYNKYPQSKANADTHWNDEFKTSYHPTFSDESIYSGQVSDKNPKGIVGGSWSRIGKPSYRLSKSLLANGWDVELTRRIMDPKEELKTPYDPYTITERTLPSGEVVYLDEHGNLLENAGYNLIGPNGEMYYSKNAEPLTNVSDWDWKSGEKKDLNAYLRLGQYMQNAAARDFDKVMLTTIGAISAPIAAQAFGATALASNLVPGSSFWLNPITKSMLYGTAGATGADIAAKAVTGKTFEEWGEQDLGLPWYLSGFVNPGGYLAPTNAAPKLYQPIQKLSKSKDWQFAKLDIPDQYAGINDFGDSQNAPNMLKIARGRLHYVKPENYITTTDINKIVDKDGNIDKRAFERAVDYWIKRPDRARDYVPHTLEDRVGNDIIKDHLYAAASTAQTAPVPLNSTKLKQVLAALLHDIGKLFGYENHDSHGKYILHPDNKVRMFLNIGDDILDVVTDHMSTKTFKSDNDLLRATQFADVARGLSYDEAAIRYPHLLYRRQGIKQPTFEKIPLREELKKYINPWLKDNNYGPQDKDGKFTGIPLDATEEEAWSIIEDVMRQHRRMLRGSRLSDLSKGMSKETIEKLTKERDAAILKTKKSGEEITDQDKLLWELEHINSTPTGYGRANLFHPHLPESGLSYNEQNSVSKAFKIDPKIYDGKYTSYSDDIKNTYQSSYGRSDRKGIGAEIELTGGVERTPDMSMREFVLRNDWDLYAPKGEYPIGLYNMLLWPFRLLTGKSLFYEASKHLKGGLRRSVVKPKLEKPQLKRPRPGTPEYGDSSVPPTGRFILGPHGEAIPLQSPLGQIYELEGLKRSYADLKNGMQNVNDFLKKAGMDRISIKLGKNGEIYYPSELSTLMHEVEGISKNSDIAEKFIYGLLDIMHKHTPDESFFKGIIDDLLGGHHTHPNLFSVQSANWDDVQLFKSALYLERALSSKEKAIIHKQYEKGNYEKIINYLSDNMSKFRKKLAQQSVDLYFDGIKRSRKDSGFANFIKNTRDPKLLIQVMREYGAVPRHEIQGFNDLFVVSTANGSKLPAKKGGHSTGSQQLAIIGRMDTQQKVVKSIKSEFNNPETHSLHRDSGRLSVKKLSHKTLASIIPAILVAKSAQNTDSEYSSGKDIYIKPSRRGTFTAAAKKHGMSVQAYARKVLKAPKGKYSSAMRKKANFARNASRWNK